LVREDIEVVFYPTGDRLTQHLPFVYIIPPPTPGHKILRQWRELGSVARHRGLPKFVLISKLLQDLQILILSLFRESNPVYFTTN
jgi:hypothetical protein